MNEQLLRAYIKQRIDWNMPGRGPSSLHENITGEMINHELRDILAVMDGKDPHSAEGAQISLTRAVASV